MKNILLFGHGYATQFIDISNQYTRLFDPKNFRVTVVYLVGEPDETVRQKHLADEVIFLNCPKSSTRGLKIFAIRKMLKLQREKNFQLVVCHRYKPTYVMLWVNLFAKIPLLFSVMHELRTLKNFMRKCLIKLLAGNNIIFAGVSNAVRDDIRQSIWGIPNERVITLYNMIDTDLTEPAFLTREAARDKLHLQEGDFIFGTIGRLVINKDQKTLIAAFAKIKSACPNAKLVILGQGVLEQLLKEQVKQLGLTNDVIFTGFLPDGFRFVKAFDVYVSPSIQEAFGRVLLEAMLGKVPIIATRVNGVPEVIGNAGLLIDALNITQLADNMLTLYQASRDERAALGQKGYERAYHEFSLKKFNEIFWELDVTRVVK